MKKFLAIMIAVLCLCTMGVAADPDTKTTTVEYEVDSGYTWAIHDGIDFGSNLGVGHNDATSSQTAQIDSADNGVAVLSNVIDDGKKLQITVIGANMSSNQYRVVNGSTYLNYAISKNADMSSPLVANAVVLEVAAGTNTGNQALYFRLNTGSATAEVAGSYLDTLTYTATIVDA
ncbi:MAG: hypothetical protein IKF80_04500 [Erysipelotrichaceae bacterium]|nr:hypothetical protein [Erysipelotrichaceae bacterium]